jgi:hypothetical protein
VLLEDATGIESRRSRKAVDCGEEPSSLGSATGEAEPPSQTSNAKNHLGPRHTNCPGTSPMDLAEELAILLVFIFIIYITLRQLHTLNVDDFYAVLEEELGLFLEDSILDSLEGRTDFYEG